MLSTKMKTQKIIHETHINTRVCENHKKSYIVEEEKTKSFFLYFDKANRSKHVLGS